jgi:hypothetical protein
MFFFRKLKKCSFVFETDQSKVGQMLTILRGAKNVAKAASKGEF